MWGCHCGQTKVDAGDRDSYILQLLFELFAKVYTVVERHRFVWVWIGDEAKADTALVQDFCRCSTPGGRFDGEYMHLACNYRLLIDNLRDLTHETYVPRGSIGQPELMEAPIETKVEKDRVVVSRWMPGIDAPPFSRNALKKDGPVHRWQVCHFPAPSNVIIDVGVAPADGGATLERHEQGVCGFVFDAIKPESATTCHYFWGMARNFDQQDAGFTGRFKKPQSMAFDEDLVVLEAWQRAVQLNPGMRLRNFNIDAGGVNARIVIERLLKQQNPVQGGAD
jgi:phenylpropionate dioxygenase-like ring-hydroxylating dioxygenase large terminal subunit